MNCFFNRSTMSIIDTIREDGRGSYSGKTLAEVEVEYGTPITIEDWNEAWKIIEEHHKKPPVEITEEDFWYFLEVLPPCRWFRAPGAESFYMSEFQTGDITTHLVRIGTRYFKLDDDFRLTHNEVVTKCSGLYACQPNPNLESKMK